MAHQNRAEGATGALEEGTNTVSPAYHRTQFTAVHATSLANCQRGAQTGTRTITTTDSLTRADSATNVDTLCKSRTQRNAAKRAEDKSERRGGRGKQARQWVGGLAGRPADADDEVGNCRFCRSAAADGTMGTESEAEVGRGAGPSVPTAMTETGGVVESAPPCGTVGTQKGARVTQ